MDLKARYKIIKRTAALVVATVAFYGTALGIVQYYENRSSHHIAGEWDLNLKIESTSYNPYKNLEVGYKIYLSQHEKRVVGRGEKWWVDGEEIPFSQHDPIRVEGVMIGNELPLSFILKGSKRETVGTFDLRLESEDKFIGTFSTTGANSRGSVVMTKTLSSSSKTY